MTGPATYRRLQVAELRIRLERVAAAAFDAVCQPTNSRVQTSIPKRLLFLVGLVEPVRQAEVHRLTRLGAHVYRRSSDVLHGRMNSLDLSDVVMDEWRIIVSDMEQILVNRSVVDKI